MNQSNVIDVDFGNDERPKYLVLESAVRAAIAQGRLTPGMRLPPVRDLAWKVGVTPGTVARVYRTLTETGVLEASVGRGTFVATPTKPETWLVPSEPTGVTNLRMSQVVNVGQDRMIADVMASLGPSSEGYATYPARESDARLRRSLADWLHRHGSMALDPEAIVLTLGAQHALVVLCQALLRGSRPIMLTEELCYPGFRHAAGLCRAELRGVPFDGNGLDPAALERMAAQGGVQILVTSSGAHNPTTTRTSPERRAQIVSICERYDIQIIDDDCFSITPAGPTYADLAPARTWMITSLSKTVSPALRLGVIGAPPGRMEEVLVVAQQQFFGLPRPQLDLVQALIDSGTASKIRDAVVAKQTARARRARAILAEADMTLRDDCPFAWLRLPRGWRGSSFLRAAESEGVLLKAADEFALVDGHAPNAVRLALNGTQREEDFEAALATVARLLARPPLELET